VKWLTLSVATKAGGYGSLRSQGRQKDLTLLLLGSHLLLRLLRVEQFFQFVDLL
jgi:hypothetical protein